MSKPYIAPGAITKRFALIEELKPLSKAQNQDCLLEWQFLDMTEAKEMEILIVYLIRMFSISSIWLMFS